MMLAFFLLFAESISLTFKVWRTLSPFFQTRRGEDFPRRYPAEKTFLPLGRRNGGRADRFFSPAGGVFSPLIFYRSLSTLLLFFFTTPYAAPLQTFFSGLGFVSHVFYFPLLFFSLPFFDAESDMCIVFFVFFPFLYIFHVCKGSSFV